MWGRQLIFERGPFIFLEAESGPVETSSTVPMWMCLCVCALTHGSGVTHLEWMCVWTRGVGVRALCVPSQQTSRSQETCGCMWICVLTCAASKVVCVYMSVCICMCVHPWYCPGLSFRTPWPGP